MNVLESIFKNFLEPISYLIYAIVLFLKFSRGKNFGTTILFIYYQCATLLLLAASYLAMDKTRQKDNNFLYNIFYLITICALSWYFFKLLNTRIKKNVVIILVIINLVFFLSDNITAGHLAGKYNGYIFAICNLSIVIYALLYFDQLLRNVGEHNILYEFDFWLVSGYLLYFLGCFFIILYYESAAVLQRGNLWGFQNVILFLSSLITLTGYLWIHFRKKLY